MFKLKGILTLALIIITTIHYTGLYTVGIYTMASNLYQLINQANKIFHKDAVLAIRWEETWQIFFIY